MKHYSTREAAQQLGLDVRSIQRYIKAGKIPVPPLQNLGGGKFRVWTEAEIENVRKLLPKIANGRKTRYKKKQSAISSQQSVKTKKKTQARAPALHKKK